jgi:hypothetical protein
MRLSSGSQSGHPPLPPFIMCRVGCTHITIYMAYPYIWHIYGFFLERSSRQKNENIWIYFFGFFVAITFAPVLGSEPFHLH